MNKGNSAMDQIRPEEISDSDIRQDPRNAAILFKSVRARQFNSRNSSYAGLPMAGPHFEKLCANSGTSALLRQCARSRNIKSSFQTSAYLN